METDRHFPTGREAASEDAVRSLIHRALARGWWGQRREAVHPAPELGLEQCFGKLD